MRNHKINFGWESLEEKVRRGMAITPKNKLIWLKKINELACVVSLKHKKKQRRAAQT